MNGGVGKIEEERLFAVLLDEGNGFLGVARGDGGILLHTVLDHGQVAHEGEGDCLAIHVVAVGYSEV